MKQMNSNTSSSLGAFSATAKSPDNLEHVVQNWLINIYRQVWDIQMLPGLKA